MFKQILFSPPVKRCEMITCKPGIYESLPHKLPNYLRHRKLRNIRKVLKPHRIIAQRPAPPRMKTPPTPAKNPLPKIQNENANE